MTYSMKYFIRNNFSIIFIIFHINNEDEYSL